MARARLATTQLKAAAHRTRRSTCAAVFAFIIAAVAKVATAMAAITLCKVTEVACRAPERPGAQAAARPMAKSTIWPKTAGKICLLPVRPLPPQQN
jgi:hypothetical protein